MNILIALLFLLFPALVIFLCYKVKFIRKIGAVLICYIAGMIVGNIGILPGSFAPMQAMLQDYSVVIALPLLLFSLNIKKWFKVAGKGLLCMLLAVVSIVIVTVILQLTMGRGDPEAYKLGGLAIGLYTGGTPNLAAIKAALNVSDSTYILFHTYDTVVSLVYIFLMVSIARPIFIKVFRLKAFSDNSSMEQNLSDENTESMDTYKGIFKGKTLLKLGIALLISLAIVALSAFVLGELVPEDYFMTVVILSITTLSIAASFIKPIRNIEKTFSLGMYIIYVFCFTVASMTDFNSLININFGILAYVLIAIFGSLILHTILSKLFKIDADTMIITSVSAICSPPFVPVVADGLKNKKILMTGITTGIIGYAIGNYLGIWLGLLFKLF